MRAVPRLVSIAAILALFALNAHTLAADSVPTQAPCWWDSTQQVCVNEGCVGTCAAEPSGPCMCVF